jgi:radical SAM protein with 4Fe4S-binding SPASM domain
VEARTLASALEVRGRQAELAWRNLAEKSFEPECLTLYLSNRCNLACSYCYSAPVAPAGGRASLRMVSEPVAEAAFPILKEPVIYAAARLVARSCAGQRKPLTLVLHGGGEPTLHWSLLQRVIGEVQRIASAHGVSMFSYIATHGLLPEDRAAWLAANFSLIGLSCDGPPDIQNANRPFVLGSPTADIVERTAAVFARAGAVHDVRMTVTPENVKRQREIALYACERLCARTVRFEPVYDARRTSGPRFRPEQAEEFVEHFLDAREAVRQRGGDLVASGVRIDEIHGPYCNPLRDTLQLTPDGVATACFLSTGSGEAHEQVMAFGRFDAATSEFVVDQEQATALRRRAARVPERCRACGNVYHCARDCPDTCVITTNSADEPAEGFRCRVQQLLGHREIWDMAQEA